MDTGYEKTDSFLIPDLLGPTLLSTCISQALRVRVDPFASPGNAGQMTGIRPLYFEDVCVGEW